MEFRKELDTLRAKMIAEIKKTVSARGLKREPGEKVFPCYSPDLDNISVLDADDERTDVEAVIVTKENDLESVCVETEAGSINIADLTADDICFVLEHLEGIDDEDFALCAEWADLAED